MKRSTTPEQKMVIRFSRESRILTPRPSSGIENFINFNDAPSLRTELLEIKGNENGEYWNPGRRNAANRDMHTAVLPSLLGTREALQERFEKYKQSEISMGNRPPKVWPSNLEDDRIILDSQIAVKKLEIEKLEGLISSMEEKKEEEESAPYPRKRWSSCELKNGILHKIAGWLVDFPEGADTLHVMDKRSPFDGMPVWMFKSRILKAIEMEESYVKRMELKNAEAEDRRPRPVEKVATPTWNLESRQIEYPNYSNKTIQKLKIDM